MHARVRRDACKSQEGCMQESGGKHARVRRDACKSQEGCMQEFPDVAPSMRCSKYGVGSQYSVVRMLHPLCGHPSSSVSVPKKDL